jgi:hypothetical protein
MLEIWGWRSLGAKALPLLIAALHMDPVPPHLNGGCRRQSRWRRLLAGATINRTSKIYLTMICQPVRV